MDLATHALLGAVIGAKLGSPWLGAVVAVLPDVALGARRRALPNAGYNTAHSLLVLISIGGVLAFFPIPVKIYWTIMLAWGSHILLDYPTHGKDWAPQTFYPICKTRHSFGGEWEFFNSEWFAGLLFTLCFISLMVLF